MGFTETEYQLPGKREFLELLTRKERRFGVLGERSIVPKQGDEHCRAGSWVVYEMQCVRNP